MSDHADTSAHAQIYQTGTFAAFPKRIYSVPGGVLATMRVAQTPFQSSFPSVQECALATSVRTGRGRVSIRDGGRWKSSPLAVGSLELKSAGIQREYDIDAETELIFVTFPPLEGGTSVRQILGRDIVDFGPLVESICHVNSDIPRLMRLIWDQAQLDGTSASLLHIDCYFTALIAALLRESGHLPRRSTKHEVLSVAQLRRSTEIIQDKLIEGVRLEELAERVGLSEFHFIRAFRNTVGIPPHRFQLRLRVNSARKLLSSSDLPLASIAQACGFSTQSHMGSVFHRVMGKTPLDWRRLSQTGLCKSQLS